MEALILRLVSGSLDTDTFYALPEYTLEEKNEGFYRACILLALRNHGLPEPAPEAPLEEFRALSELIENSRDGARARARKLLLSFLSPSQRRELRHAYGFTVIGSEGGRYRLYPSTGLTVAVERRGSRWFARRRFCLHDDPQVLPSPDLSLTHMLMLLADEQLFLATANEREVVRGRP